MKSYDKFIEKIREIHAHTLGNSKIKIAIIDTDVNTKHEVFSNTDLYRIDAFPNRSPQEHGTGVASIILGQSSNYTGIASGCTGVIIPAFDASGSISQLNLANAINLAIEEEVHIINISAGKLSDVDNIETTLKSALEACNKQGILVVSAVGNEGCDCIHFPAAHNQVLAVGGLDTEGQPSAQSNYGKAYAQNGVLVPAHEVKVGYSNNKYTIKTGTSYAAPLVSGLAGLLLSLQVEANQKATPLLVKQAILTTSTACSNPNINECSRFLHGILDIEKTFQYFNNLIKNNLIMKNVNLSDLESNGSILNTEQQVQMNDTEVTLSDCSCNSKKKKRAAPQKVYALGTLSVDFGQRGNRNSLMQTTNNGLNSDAEILAMLGKKPYEAESMIWILKMDEVPIYAIYPTGSYASKVYEDLTETWKAQTEGRISRVAIPGVIAGEQTLLNGDKIPLIIPNIRGISAWSTQDLIHLVYGEQPTDEESILIYLQKTAALNNFLDRVYFELRNLGVTAKERAINFAATNAFQAAEVLESTYDSGFELSNIEVEKSPIAQPGADNWDVKLIFFNPSKRIEQARRVYRFTIDVSYVIPVSVGQIRSWSIY